MRVSGKIVENIARKLREIITYIFTRRFIFLWGKKWLFHFQGNFKTSRRKSQVGGGKYISDKD
jgi:hypothetical protein